MFPHALLSSLFNTVMGETAPSKRVHIQYSYQDVYALFISLLVLEKIFGGKQSTVLPPWLHPVCDVAKAGLL